MNRAGARGRVVGLCGVLLAVGLTPAAGQIVPTADTAAADTVSAIPLGPVRVTVLRSPLVLSRIPRAVTAETPRGPRAPGRTLAEALGDAPGVQVDSRFNFSQGDRISIRGFGARSQFGVRGVKVLVDGVPATMPDGQTSLSHVDPWTVTRAEVVRGPASSLWGNASGGVIQLETGVPRSAGVAGSWTSMIGADGLRHHGVEAGWGGAPSTSGSGLRSVGASASRLEWDGFREHASATKTFGSARMTWTGARSELAVVAHGVTYDAANPGSLSAELLSSDRTQAYPFNVVQQAGESADQAQLGARWSRRLSPGAVPGAGGVGGAGATTLELTGWAMHRRVDNPIPPAIIALDRTAGGVRAQIRGVESLAGRPVRWVAGLDIGAQWDDRRNHENEAGEAGALTLDQRERVEAVAPFVELAARIAGPVQATAGLRLDRHRFTADDDLVADADPDDSGVRRMHQLSPSAGLLADLGRAILYANVASSFETPTTTELVNRPSGAGGLNPELGPQRAWTAEVGARMRPGARLGIGVAAFRTSIRGALVPFEVPDAPGRSFFRNAGEATHRGLELDVRAEPGAGLRARATYAWLDARFDRFATESGDHAGNRVPGVARHRLRGTLAWHRAGGGSVELSTRYVGAIAVDDANTASAPAYAVTDLRLTLPAVPVAGAELEVLAGVENLLDRAYVASVVVNAFGGRYYEPGPGRSAFLGIRARLGSGRDRQNAGPSDT